MKPFSFPTFFEAPLFKPLIFFFSLLHFPPAFISLISHSFCTYSFDYSVFSTLTPLITQFPLFLQYAPFFVLLFPFRVLFLPFLCVPFPFQSFISPLPQCLMVDYSNIRCTSPSIAFFFARLGASLGSFNSYYPRVGDFALGDSSLGLVLGSLYPLLHQSLHWFGSMREVLRREYGF